tara:strand:- start:9068 stop:9931 length:864 start_codon:yes stop_codon:yes gene_type:complete
MSEKTNIVDVNEDDFNDKVIEASVNKLIVVDFWAPWCGPCKQLTPVLEKILNGSDKVTLVKINIDENQQIAAQLRIQSIPTVYAFKDKQIANAFQGVIPEKQVIEFIEKCLGSKINEDYTEFFREIKESMDEKKFEDTKDTLLDFISKNPDEIKAMYFYLECCLELKQLEEAVSFIDSLNNEMKEKNEIVQLIKKIEIIKNNLSGPNISELISKLEKKPDDINLIIEVADKYFSIKDYVNSMNLLLDNYPKNKEKIKNKMVEFFEVLGNSNEFTIKYRKKLSQMMFS